MQHVVATAGHVDHGKSTLVRALTGMEPDRFAEEQRRGLTLDLGYAWTTLPGGQEIAFVDVPGHQRFTANMLAGVGTVPAVLFVVAADEGWSRQSGEHLAALHSLRVAHGLLAVTRSDLADPEPVIADVRARLAGSSLGEVDSVAVSGVTGQGLDRLRTALGVLVDGLPQPPDEGRVRLWVDRVFTVPGSGTVVTGTLPAGRLTVGDELEVQPSGRRVRVRSLQTLRTRAEQVTAVARVGVNVRDGARAGLERGASLVTPGTVAARRVVDVRLEDVRVAEPRVGGGGSGDGEPRLPPEAVLHVGSAGVAVAVRPLGDEAARLTLDTPLPLLVGDRGVLRDPGAQQVVAGVVVVDPDPPPLRRRGAAAARGEVLARLDGRPDPVDEVARRGPVRAADLVALGVLAPAALTPGTATSTGLVDVGGVLAVPAQVGSWRAALLDLVVAHARDHPLDGGLPRETVRQALGLADARVLAAVVDGVDEVEDVDGRLLPRGTAAAAPPEAAAALEALRAALADQPFVAPPGDGLDALGLTPAVLAVLGRAGLVLRLPGGVVLPSDAEAEAVRRLVALPQPFTVADARTALGTSRRVALPLLEHLDARRLTRRVDATYREVRRGG